MKEKSSLEEEKKQAMEKIIEQENSILDEKKRVAQLENSLHDERKRAAKLETALIEEEIKKQNGTMQDLKSSFILENEHLEKNIEEMSNASLKFNMFRLGKAKIL